MILYNVTIKLEEAIREDWLDWMKTVHIPAVMRTGMFLENRLCHLLLTDDDGGITFSIQYLCPDQAHFDRYQKDFAPKLQKEQTDRYKNRFVAFRTLMEVLHTS